MNVPEKSVPEVQETQEPVQNEDVVAPNADIQTVQNTQTRPTGSLMDIINTLQAGQDRIDALTGNNRQRQIFDSQNELINQQRYVDQNKQNEAAHQGEQRRYDEFLGGQNEFLRGMPAAQNTQTAAIRNAANVNMPVNESVQTDQDVQKAAMAIMRDESLSSGSNSPTSTPTSTPIPSTDTAGIKSEGIGDRPHYGNNDLNNTISQASESVKAGAGTADKNRAVSNLTTKPVTAEEDRQRKNTAKVRTARGTEIEVKYKIMELDDLIASNKANGSPNPDYPQELQPRDRSRQASSEQVNRIARNIDPELLGANRMASDGAPIIGTDRVVESGNGRVMAIRKAYFLGDAGNYVKWLKQHAAEFGLTNSDFNGIKQPVLVRERQGNIDRVKFVNEANEASISRMSQTEQAMSDAERVTPEMLARYNPDKEVQNNKDFVNLFMFHIVGKNDMEQYMTEDGELSQDGVQRIKNALMAKAYNDNKLMNRLRESLNNDIKNVTTGMLQASAKIAILENAASNGGAKPELSISKDITKAASVMAQLKKEDKKVGEYLSQLSMFSDADISKAAKKILKFFDDNSRAPRRIANMLARYAELAMNEGTAGQRSMFDLGRDKNTLIDEAIDYVENPDKYYDKNSDLNSNTDEIETYSQNKAREIDEGQLEEVYGHKKTLQRLNESGENDRNVRSVVIGLDKAAQDISELNDAIKNGDVNADLGLADDVMQAANTLTDLRGEDYGVPVKWFLEHKDEFQGVELSEDAEKLLEFFDRNRGSGEIIAAGLSKYAELAMNNNQGLDKSELLKQAIQYTKSPDGYAKDRADDRAQSRLVENLTKAINDLHSPVISKDDAGVYAHFIANTYRYFARNLGISLDEATRMQGLEFVMGGKAGGNFLTQDIYEQIMYHGTRHNLGGRFDLLKIGTGEGMQMYGWGIYLAENREVSEYYRTAGESQVEKVSFTGKNGEKFDFKKYDSAEEPISSAFKRLAFNEVMRELNMHPFSLQQDAQNELNDMRRKAEQAKSADDKAYWEKMAAKWEKISPVSVSMAANPGNLYTVDGPENDVLLDWDVPLSEQPESVKKAIKKVTSSLKRMRMYDDILQEMTDNGATGADFYSGLTKAMWRKDSMRRRGYSKRGDQAASELLNKYGISGLRYWDEGSREAKAGTHNFVVWNTDLLKIMGVEGTAAESEKYNQERMPTTQEIAEVGAQIKAVRKQYEGTEQWLKAPNGEKSNLDERTWCMVRTPNFKRWFGDFEAAAEIKAMRDRLTSWTSQANLNRAKGKSREEIFKEFGNELQPIAYIPEGYLQHFDGSMTDNRVYSGMGYFLDHVVNHHPETAASQYLNIQKVIDTADDVKLDTGTASRNKSILFIKNIGTQGVVIVSFNEGENGKIVLYKTFFDKTKAGRFNKMPSIKMPLKVGNPSISPKTNVSAAGRLSALNGNTKIANTITAVNPDSVSKVVDENGEPLVVYHGTDYGGFSVFNTSQEGIFFSNYDRASWYTHDYEPKIIRRLPDFKSWEDVKDYAREHDIDFEEADKNEYGDGKFFINGEITWDLNEASDILFKAQSENGNIGNIYACFLNIKKPNVIHAKGKSAYDIEQIRKNAKQDGVIVYDVVDGTYDEGSQFEATNYIVFNPEQIKAIDNIGTFNPADPDIYHQDASAEAKLAADEQAWGELINRFKNGELTKEERSGLLPVMQTPLVFQLVGMDLLPVEIRLDNLNKILNKKHKLSPETLKQIPRAITDPIMIFNSEHDEGRGRDSRVILTELKETGNDGIERNVIAALTLGKSNERQGYEINELTTVYRKDTSSKQQLTPEQDILDWITKTYKDGQPMNLLQYINKEKASEWVKSAGTTPMAFDTNGSSKASDWSVSEGFTPREFDTNVDFFKNIPNETDLVKLREENAGLYQGNTNDTRRGYVEFVPEQRDNLNNVVNNAKAIIHMLEHGDKSTIIHEGAHRVLDFFWKVANDERLSPAARKDWEVLTKWLKISDIDFSKPFSQADKKRLKSAHEKFASGAEQYFMTGKAPNSRIKRMFEAVKGWIRHIYQTAKNILYTDADGRQVPFNLSKEVREVYEHIFSGGEGMINPLWAEERASNLEVGEADIREYFTPEKLRDNEFVETADGVVSDTNSETKLEVQTGTTSDVLSDLNNAVNNEVRSNTAANLAAGTEAIMAAANGADIQADAAAEIRAEAESENESETGEVARSMKSLLTTQNNTASTPTLKNAMNEVLERGVTPPTNNSVSDRADNDYRFSSNETEKRFRDSRGDIEYRERLRKKWRTGNFKELRNISQSGADFAFARAQIQTLVGNVGAAPQKAERMSKTIIKGLKPAEVDLFMRKRILDDLMWRKGELPDAKLPWGLDDETLKRDHERVTRLAEQNPKIMEAIRRDEEFTAELNREMISLARKLGIGNLEKVLRNPHYFHHEILFNDSFNPENLTGMNRNANSGGNVNSGIDGLMGRLLTPFHNRGWLKKYEGSERDMSSNYLQVMSDVRGQQMQDIAVMKTLLKIKEKYDIGDALRAKLGKKAAKSQNGGEVYSQTGLDAENNGNNQSLRDTVPDGYTIFDPNTHGLLSTGENDAFEQLIGMALDNGIDKSDMSESAKNGFRELIAEKAARVWVIPKELKSAFVKLAEIKKPSKFIKALRAITHGWKKWETVGLPNFFKFNFRNITGDVDAVLAGNPRTMKYTGKAAKELWGVFFRGKDATGDLADYLDRGGDNSSDLKQYFDDPQLYFDFVNDPEFQQVEKEIQESGGFKGFLKKGSKKVGRFLDKWLISGLPKLSSYRENILRYATYLSYLEQMKKNKDGMPDNWGASLKEEVMALDDIRDRAYKMANELLGDYDNISELGQKLRDLAVPFYSFFEVNAKRYWRLLKNGFTDGNGFHLKDFKAERLPLYTWRVARTLFMINMLNLFIKAFNHWVTPEAEDALPPEVQARPHWTFGRIDGKVVYFDRIGATLDLLDWVGQDSAVVPFYQDVKDIFNGQETVGEFLQKTGGAFFSKAINSLNPMFKLPFEIATGRTIYPDALHPRTIRDMPSYIAQTFGIAREVNAMRGEPGKDYVSWDRLLNLVTYQTDPKEGAYFYILDKVRRFQERELGKTFDGGAITRRGEALRKLKTAIRYKDRKNIRYYLRKYYQLGGKRKNLEQSVQRMEPLSGLNKEEKAQFLRTLSVEDRKYLRRAMRYFAELSATLGVKAKLF